MTEIKQRIRDLTVDKTDKERVQNRINETDNPLELEELIETLNQINKILNETI